MASKTPKKSSHSKLPVTDPANELKGKKMRRSSRRVGSLIDSPKANLESFESSSDDNTNEMKRIAGLVGRKVVISGAGLLDTILTPKMRKFQEIIPPPGFGDHTIRKSSSSVLAGATSGQKVNEMGRIGGRHSGSQVTPGLQVRNKRSETAIQFPVFGDLTFRPAYSPALFRAASEQGKNEMDCIPGRQQGRQVMSQIISQARETPTAGVQSGDYTDRVAGRRSSRMTLNKVDPSKVRVKRIETSGAEVVNDKMNPIPGFQALTMHPAPTMHHDSSVPTSEVINNTIGTTNTGRGENIADRILRRRAAVESTDAVPISQSANIIETTDGRGESYADRVLRRRAAAEYVDPVPISPTDKSIDTTRRVESHAERIFGRRSAVASVDPVASLKSANSNDSTTNEQNESQRGAILRRRAARESLKISIPERQNSVIESADRKKFSAGMNSLFARHTARQAAKRAAMQDATVKNGDGENANTGMNRIPLRRSGPSIGGRIATAQGVAEAVDDLIERVSGPQVLTESVETTTVKILNAAIRSLGITGGHVTSCQVSRVMIQPGFVDTFARLNINPCTDFNDEDEDEDGSSTEVDSDSQRVKNHELVAKYETSIVTNQVCAETLYKDFAYPVYDPMHNMGPFPPPLASKVESDRDDGEETETGRKKGSIVPGYAIAHDARIARILAGDDSSSDDSDSETERNDALEKKYAIANRRGKSQEGVLT